MPGDAKEEIETVALNKIISRAGRSQAIMALNRVLVPALLAAILWVASNTLGQFEEIKKSVNTLLAVVSDLKESQAYDRQRIERLENYWFGRQGNSP